MRIYVRMAVDVSTEGQKKCCARCVTWERQ